MRTHRCELQTPLGAEQFRREVAHTQPLHVPMREVQEFDIHVSERKAMTATRFAPVHNIFTGQEVIDFVPIPTTNVKRKGTTQHDAKFEKLLDFKQALRVPEHEFGGMRKALQRFLDNKSLRQQVSMRQLKDHKTKSYSIWLVNEPPQVVIPRSKK
jgi:hypothetical protein